MGRELMIYDEIGACRVGAAFCPSPFAAAARDPHVSFSPFLWNCEPKNTPFEWFCCLEVLELLEV